MAPARLEQAVNLRLQADVARLAGDSPYAAVRYATALRMYSELGDAGSVAGCLAGLAAVAAPARPERAARLLGACEALGGPDAVRTFTRVEHASLVAATRRRWPPTRGRRRGSARAGR